MAHFGVLAYKGAGHLHPLFALSRKLVARGHKVTFFLPEEMKDAVQAHGLGFCAMPPEPKRVAGAPAPRSTWEWVTDTRTHLRRLSTELDFYLQAYPQAIRGRGVDALVLGEITLAGPTVAELLGLPYFVVSTSMPHNFGWSAPRRLQPVVPWQGRVQQNLLEVSVTRMHGPVRQLLRKRRKLLGLPPECAPELAHVTQWPLCLDTRRAVLPARFCFAGPFARGDAGRPLVPFPWEQLDGRPLVYSSLGTTKRGGAELLARIADACAALGMQAAISMGGRAVPEELRRLPGNPVVVERAPQRLLLQRCELVVTHAGPNTVLEALLEAKPMLLLPLALDQPAIAARLEALGCAVALGPRERSVRELRQGMQALRTQKRFRAAAEALRDELGKIEGPVLAAQVMEDSLRKSVTGDGHTGDKCGGCRF